MMSGMKGLEILKNKGEQAPANQGERSGSFKPSVVIATRLKKTSERIDGEGNIIDPVTKQIIKRNGDR